MAMMDLIRDNPILIKHIRSRLRYQQMLPAIIIVLSITGLLALLGMLEVLSVDNGRWETAMMLMLILQIVILPLIGTAQVAGSVGQARESGMMDFHRISPQSPTAQALGFLLGAPIYEFILFCATLPGYALLIISAPIRLLMQQDIRLDHLWLLPVVIVVLSLMYQIMAILVGLSVSGQQRRSAGVLVIVMILLLNGLLWSFPPLSYLSIVPTIFMAFGGEADHLSFTIRFFGMHVPVWLLTILHLGVFVVFLWHAVVRKIRKEHACAFTRPMALLFIIFLGILTIGDLGITDRLSTVAVSQTNLQMIVIQVLLLALVLVAASTPMHSQFVKGIRMACKLGRPKVSPWSDAAANTYFVLICAVLVLIFSVLGASLASLTTKVDMFSMLINAEIAAGVVLQFGFGYQYFGLIYRKHATNYFLIAVFLIWLIPVLLGVIVYSINSAVPAWQYIMSASPPCGLSLAFDSAHGPTNRLIAGVATFLWVSLATCLLLPRARALTRAVTIASRPEYDHIELANQDRIHTRFT